MDIRNAAVGFSFGVVVAHWLPTAHPLWVCWFCAGVMLMPVRRAQTLGAALIGLAWGAVNATDALDRRIGPGCAEATLVGRVVDLPAALGHAGGVTQRFVVEPERSSCEIGGNVRLSWRDGPGVGAGEVWRLHVRLKAPRANANRHGFDAEAWLARDKLAATGYVLRGTRVSIEGSTRIGGIDGPLVWRGTLRERLGQLPLVNAGVIAALTLGDRTGISSQQADLYRRTGTMHLLVISGLHVGIVTALGFLLGRGAGTVAGISARSAGVVTALLFAAGYVLVAGPSPWCGHLRCPWLAWSPCWLADPQHRRWYLPMRSPWYWPSTPWRLSARAFGCPSVPWRSCSPSLRRDGGGDRGWSRPCWHSLPSPRYSCPRPPGSRGWFIPSASASTLSSFRRSPCSWCRCRWQGSH